MRLHALHLPATLLEASRQRSIADDRMETAKTDGNNPLFSWCDKCRSVLAAGHHRHPPFERLWSCGTDERFGFVAFRICVLKSFAL